MTSLEKLEELYNDGVQVSMYLWPQTSYRGGFHVKLEKQDSGIKMEVDIQKNGSLDSVIDEAYSKWYGNAPRMLTAPQIEHRSVAPVDLDDEIPF